MYTDEKKKNPDEEVSFNAYAYQEYQIKLKSVEGKKGIREYEIVDLNKIGKYGEMDGVPLPEFKVIVYPNKRKPMDEFSLACGYFQQ